MEEQEQNNQPEQEIPQSPIVEVETSSNKLTLSLSVVLVVVVLLVGGYFFFVENNNPYSVIRDEDKTTNNIPSDWQTYINKDYGFSLRHPTDWIVGDSSIDSSCNKMSIVNIVSPIRYNLPGYADIPVIYAVAGPDSNSFVHADFIDPNKRSGSMWNLDGSKYNKKETPEYKVGQKIIESFRIFQGTPAQSTSTLTSFSNDNNLIFSRPCHWNLTNFQGFEDQHVISMALLCPGDAPRPLKTRVFCKLKGQPIPTTDSNEVTAMKNNGLNVVYRDSPIIIFQELKEQATKNLKALADPNYVDLGEKDGWVYTVYLNDQNYLDIFNEMLSSFKIN